MENEELKEIHSEAVEPQSKAEEAHGLDLSISSTKLADDNTKEIILTALKINGVNNETLNISKSKFSKLSKIKLIDALKAHLNDPDPKSEDQPKEAKQEFDYISSIMSLKSTVEKAVKSGEYSSLDSEIAGTVLNAMNSDENIQNLDIKSSSITKIVIGLGAVYFISRLVGFETISNKIQEIKNKILNRQSEKAENE